MRDSKWTKDEQTEIVRIAAGLEIAIDSERNELNKLMNQHYKTIPNPPVHKQINTNVVIQPDYSQLPQFNMSLKQYLQYKYNENHSILMLTCGMHPWITGFLSFILIAGLGSSLDDIWIGLFTMIILPIASVIFVIAYRNKVKTKYAAESAQMQQNLLTSPQYLQKKAQLEKDAREATIKTRNDRVKQQAQYDEDYQLAVAKYQNETIPKYEADKKHWTRMQALKVQALNNDIIANEGKLRELYNSTNLISVHYRDIEKLVRVYEEMATSESDLQRAIDLLNHETTNELLLQITNDIQNMHNDMMQGMHAMYMQLDAINNNTAVTTDILDDMSETLRKTRRDMNIGNIVGAYQRHKFSRQFTEFTKKFA